MSPIHNLCPWTCMPNLSFHLPAHFSDKISRVFFLEGKPPPVVLAFPPFCWCVPLVVQTAQAPRSRLAALEAQSNRMSFKRRGGRRVGVRGLYLVQRWVPKRITGGRRVLMGFGSNCCCFEQIPSNVQIHLEICQGVSRFSSKRPEVHAN